MQVNFNSQQSKQNFGMAIHSNDFINKIIKSRIKSPSELKKLGQIVDHAENNKLVDVTLFANPDGKTICANIYSTDNITNFFKSRKENFFSKSIGGGIVGFIEKCSKIADKGVEKVRKSEEIANSDIFNKMK